MMDRRSLLKGGALAGTAALAGRAAVAAPAIVPPAPVQEFELEEATVTDLQKRMASGADSAQSLIMPSVALGALTMSTFARMTRIAVLDELSRDYVTAARARGLSVRAAVFRHVLRNAAIPVVTIAALEVGNLLAGAVIVETVFAWPGVGRLLVEAISNRDYPLIQAAILFITSGFILINFLVDLSYGWLDPRVSYE